MQPSCPHVRTSLGLQHSSSPSESVSCGHMLPAAQLSRAQTRSLLSP